MLAGKRRVASAGPAPASTEVRSSLRSSPRGQGDLRELARGSTSPVAPANRRAASPVSMAAPGSPSERTMSHASPGGPGSPQAPSIGRQKSRLGGKNSVSESLFDGGSPGRQPADRYSDAMAVDLPTPAEPVSPSLRGMFGATGEFGNSDDTLPTASQVGWTPWRKASKRSQSHDVGLGRSMSEKQDSQRSFATAKWWLSEAKRMREEALRMRQERDRFRVAVEDAHFECRRLSAQVLEFETQLRTTQNALRDSKTMANAARRELERLRHWIDEAHAESRRLSSEVQEYEWQLNETRTTLDEAERSCQDLKSENETQYSELVQLREQVRLMESLGDFKNQKAQAERHQHDVENARHEARKAHRELNHKMQELEEEKGRSDMWQQKLLALQQRMGVTRAPRLSQEANNVTKASRQQAGIDISDQGMDV